MSSQPPKKLPTAPLTPYRSQAAKEIEARAGSALKEAFWMKTIQTPLGLFSRRALLFIFWGSVLLLMLFAALIWTRLQAVPSPVSLPTGDARTVITHIQANFSGNKTPIEPFFPPPNERWLFNDAYQFTWQNNAGDRLQVVVLSYADVVQLQTDYFVYTRSVNPDRQQEAVYRTNDMFIELRGEDVYGSQWKGMYLGNILLLISPQTDSQHQQELYSHLVTIMAAGQRDFIPTATPF